MCPPPNGRLCCTRVEGGGVDRGKLPPKHLISETIKFYTIMPAGISAAYFEYKQR